MDNLSDILSGLQEHIPVLTADLKAANEELDRFHTLAEPALGLLIDITDRALLLLQTYDRIARRESG